MFERTILYVFLQCMPWKFQVETWQQNPKIISLMRVWTTCNILSESGTSLGKLFDQTFESKIVWLLQNYLKINWIKQYGSNLFSLESIQCVMNAAEPEDIPLTSVPPWLDCFSSIFIKKLSFRRLDYNQDYLLFYRQSNYF